MMSVAKISHIGDSHALSSAQILNEQANKIDVTLNGVAETLLIPLLARAYDATTKNPILGDFYAKDVLVKLDYDFSKAQLAPVHHLSVAMRTRQFDQWTTSFLTSNPRAIVLHLACGLDSRAQRLDWDSEVQWIDVDLPEVVSLRRQILPVSFPGRNYQLIAASVIETAWLDQLPNDRPTIVIMEGLLSYLTEDNVKSLFSRLVNKFRRGELLFECVNTAMLHSLRQGRLTAVEQTGAKFHWGIDDLQELQRFHPQLEAVESISYLAASGVEKLPLASRFTMFLYSWFPSLRNQIRFVRARFESQQE
jgi:methyltransferase (TIGR00027 family)